MENDAKRKKKNKCFSMRKHYDFDKFWKPGMPVTEADKKMLEEVIEVYHRQGYVPTMKEVSNVQKLHGIIFSLLPDFPQGMIRSKKENGWTQSTGQKRILRILNKDFF